MTELSELAKDVATRAHRHQTRKYHAGQPYMVHPTRVAEAVLALEFSTEDVTTEEMVAAAYLHDVVEDTDWTFSDLADVFPAKVVVLVRELTAPTEVKSYEGKRPNRAARKAADRAHYAKCSLEAQVLKVLDRVDNLQDIFEASQFSDEAAKFLPVYLKESWLLAQSLFAAGQVLGSPIESLCETIEKSLSTDSLSK